MSLTNSVTDPTIAEKARIDTKNKRIVKIFSHFEIGVISPYPTVVNVARQKYTEWAYRRSLGSEPVHASSRQLTRRNHAMY